MGDVNNLLPIDWDQVSYSGSENVYNFDSDHDLDSDDDTMAGVERDYIEQYADPADDPALLYARFDGLYRRDCQVMMRNNIRIIRQLKTALETVAGNQHSVVMATSMPKPKRTPNLSLRHFHTGLIPTFGFCSTACFER